MRLMDELAQCGEWFHALSGQHALLEQIDAYLAEQELSHSVYPPRGERLNALKLTPLSTVKAIILAQDPYPGVDGERPNAMGLALSVRQGVKVPASLKNIYKELSASTQFAPPSHGDLTYWASQGVLLWNVLLTLNAGMPKSHAKSAWGQFTQAVIEVVALKPGNVVFLSFGRDSHHYAPTFERAGKTVIKTSHPSPLGASKAAKDGSFSAFMGSGCFVKANAALQCAGLKTINWQLPTLP